LVYTTFVLALVLPFSHPVSLSSLFYSDPPTSEIYPLSLHDALPIFGSSRRASLRDFPWGPARRRCGYRARSKTFFSRLLILPIEDRKSTRLNSSHGSISYAVFCLKKKKK